jgi:hypothetical protein
MLKKELVEQDIVVEKLRYLLGAVLLTAQKALSIKLKKLIKK